ncbi:MAG: SDR family oxidoreductase [Minwuia sp.]|uniref:SDR family oxidoreductase n=1 Tax=Minwuia sp. TaxID=2493630 RepID=UPI003A85F40C
MKLFCFGPGFSARALIRLLPDADVVATGRDADARARLEADGIRAVEFDGTAPLPDGALDGVTHVLASIPPGDEGDPVARCCGEQLRACKSLEWVGYLSTTGVYGDRQGGWVDETADLRPAGQRGERRVQAERDWLLLFGGADRPAVTIFRLAGIYGPGRSQFNALREGTSRRLVKPGQVFSRIHVDDIGAVLKASIEQPRPGGVYNVCDDEPAPPQDVVTHAAELLGIEPPPEVAFEDADLSPMARSFYGESKRCRNDLIKRELGVRLAYPDYRAGLKAVLAAESG